MAGLVALVLTGCGSGATRSASGDGVASRTAPVTSSTCLAAGSAASVVSADLDGDGAVESVRSLTGQGCSLLVAGIDGEDVAGTLPAGFAASSYRAVTVPGRAGQLLVVQGDVGGGSRSAVVLAYADGELAPLTRPGGTPLLSEQVGGATPATRRSLACGAGGSLVLREAVTHEPVGIMAAFDVRQTTYRLRGTALISGGTTEIADNVLPAELPRRYPGIVAGHVLVEGCR